VQQFAAFLNKKPIENLGTSAVVLVYVAVVIFLFLMAWTLRRERKDIKDHSRV
jgi:lipopolysaccharide export LptBFGC system permease protein LptF